VMAGRAWSTDCPLTLPPSDCRQRTVVQVIDAVEEGDIAAGPPELRALTPPLVRRRVWLGNAEGTT